MEVVGYCRIKKDATTGNGEHLLKFLGKTVRVIEFCVDGGVFVIANDASCLASFDKEDVVSKFECGILGEYIFPPNMDYINQIMYMTKVQNRKGGWAPILKEMIIIHSLHKGVFTDNVLWAKQ